MNTKKMQNYNTEQNKVYTYGQKTGRGSAALNFQSTTSLLSHGDGSSCIQSGEYRIYYFRYNT